MLFASINMFMVTFLHENWHENLSVLKDPTAIDFIRLDSYLTA